MATQLKSCMRKTGIAAGILLVAHLLGEAVIGPTWNQLQMRQHHLDQENRLLSAAHGIIPGLAGGMENLLVDLLWIRMHSSWMNREVAKTQVLIYAVTTLDPGPFYFWKNGARVIAYDIPHWRIEERGSRGEPVGRPERRAIHKEQALRAIRFLERASGYHPENPHVWIEIAQIYNHLLGDREAAAEYFRRASAMEGAPYYAGRLHAELLRRAGHPEAAYRFYRDWIPSLPPEDPSAAVEVVIGRIRDLEEALNIPREERFRAEVKY